MTDEKDILNVNEDILIAKCIEWDRNAQNTLYKLFASTMMGVCYRYSKTREDAEDTLQEGFMKVFENLHQFRKKGSLEGWIRKIMVNTAIQKFQKQKPEKETMMRMDNYDTSFTIQSTEEIISNIGAKELIHLIQKLPPVYQMVFNLYVFEGLKHREIAEQLGVTVGTSKSNLSDARSILQREVNKNLIIAKAVGEK